MALLARCLVVCLSLAFFLSLGCLPRGGSAKSLPRPPPNMNFTIGVEGAVWCQGCRYAGYDKSRNASPLPKAAAQLLCRRGKKWALFASGSTDEGGSFRILTPKQVAPFTSKDCTVYVQRSPVGACGVALQPSGGKAGSPLKFRKFVPLSDDDLQALYSAGEFLFGPGPSGKC